MQIGFTAIMILNQIFKSCYKKASVTENGYTGTFRTILFIQFGISAISERPVQVMFVSYMRVQVGGYF